jgi:hypothetical protein
MTRSTRYRRERKGEKIPNRFVREPNTNKAVQSLIDLSLERRQHNSRYQRHRDINLVERSGRSCPKASGEVASATSSSPAGGGASILRRGGVRLLTAPPRPQDNERSPKVPQPRAAPARVQRRRIPHWRNDSANVMPSPPGS